MPSRRELDVGEEAFTDVYHSSVSDGIVREPRYARARDGAIADGRRAIAMAKGGALGFAAVEYVLTLWTYAGPVRLAAELRLAALVATLSLLLWFALAIGLSIVMVGTRMVRGAFSHDAGRGPGCFVASPAVDGVRPGVPGMWANFAIGGAVGLIVEQAAAWAIVHFKEPQLTAGLIAGVATVAAGCAAPLRARFAAECAFAARDIAPVLGSANPLGRWRAAGVAIVSLSGASLAACWSMLPASRSVLPVRLAISVAAIALGMGLGALRHARPQPRRASRRLRLTLAAAAAILMIGTLCVWGADLETKYIAITASPPLGRLIQWVRVANDFDGDGYGSLLGENDCAPFDSSIHPGALDIPDDGIDQNCDGHDFSLRAAAEATGANVPLPPSFVRDWNVLLLTIDATRYDHTTFGGYRDSPAHRDTTPRLAELAAQSTSFSFCNAPSAGTMASIPAILTSKYFHSGIALDEHVPPGMPPKLLPENTTLPEIMKRAGYSTGVIGSHEYWNDWGLDQGVDDYDNSIGKTPDPFRVCADAVTDHVLAWVSRHQGKKWFMWAHYIDPHGRYVAHPDVVDYGATEPDLYDAEIKWTDQQIGRLLDELKRLPSWDHTMIVVTSDHGDSMGEHNVPVGSHATALYFELQHVPLIFYVPHNQPRVIGGAVSNLDIVPTIADLCGIDVRDLSFEGRSLVPQLFHGTEDHSRIVFAETNAPDKQRAAISDAWKLIFYLDTNVYELFDLRRDPTEHHNLAPEQPSSFAVMKGALDGWLERVMYARDPLFNQAMRQVRDVLLAAPPTPAVTTSGQSLDHGKLEVMGIAIADDRPARPGTTVDVHVYFAAHEHTAIAYYLMVAAWPVEVASYRPTDTPPTNMLRSAAHLTADGAFPTNRWRPGEYVRERFTMTLPANWKGDGVAIGLIASDADGHGAPATGAGAASDPTLEVLGVLPLKP